MSERLRIGIVAPPWLPIPPSAYGGTELVIDALATGLMRAGHDVTVYTVGVSTTAARRRFLFQETDPDRMGATVLELRHAHAAYDYFTHPSSAVDIVHDHTLAGLLVSALSPGVPVVTTNHGPFDADLTDLYRRVADRVPIVAISHDQASRAPSDVPIAQVIHHGLDVARYPFGPGGDDLVFLGRMAPSKGVDTAIRVARATGRRLRIAAKMREVAERRFFDSMIRPQLGDDVIYVGEADFATKVELLASAHALINPIRWPEPFGLVMAEALACGTPVVGAPEGAAPEIVDHGVTGFLAADDADLCEGIETVERIERGACRAAVLARFSSDRMARDHVALYRSVLADRSGGYELRKSA